MSLTRSPLSLKKKSLCFVFVSYVGTIQHATYFMRWMLILLVPLVQKDQQEDVQLY
jgi:hypothetical protein